MGSAKHYCAHASILSGSALSERCPGARAFQRTLRNGTQGRLLRWHPGATDGKRRALPAYAPDLLARFCKESSLTKQEMLPDVDHMDLGARQPPPTAARLLIPKAVLASFDCVAQPFVSKCPPRPPISPK